LGAQPSSKAPNEHFKAMSKPYSIKAGFDQMNIKAVHAFLSEQSYWAKNIPFEIVETALRNSFCIGAFSQKKQIAFARLITDYSTFAYLADVYVLPQYRKQGISKLLMENIMNLDWVSRLRRFMLATLDAHQLYQQYGFKPLEFPERFLEINTHNIYDGKMK
jgi:GNAT superfamily N-acetyltransferase